MSSRRKPRVTRKAEADSDSSEDENGINGRDNSSEEIPEGTVIVQPEEVKEKGTFSGPEFPRNKRKSAPSYDANTGKINGRVTCTVCGEQVNVNNKGAARQHPEIKVLMCKSCYKYHTSGPISKDEEGLDEQCRWCSEGGKLFGCDFCHNTFCKACIMRNLGRSELSVVDDEDKQWKCYVCNPKPLAGLVEECNNVLAYMKKMEEKYKQSKDDLKKKESSNIKNGIKSESTKVSDKPDGPSPRTNLSDPTKNPKLGSFQNKVAEKLAAVPQQNTLPKKANTIVIDPSSGTSKHYQFVYPKQNIQTVTYGAPSQSRLSHNVPVMTKVSQPAPSFNPPSKSASQLSLSYSKIRPGNVHSVLNRLIAATCKLEMILKSVRSNVNMETATGVKLPDEILDRDLTSVQRQSRNAAIECVIGGVDIFLQELQMTTSHPVAPAAPPKGPEPSQVPQDDQHSGKTLFGLLTNRDGGRVDSPVKFNPSVPLGTSTPKSKDIKDDVIEIESSSPKMDKESEKEMENKDVIEINKESVKDVTEVSVMEIDEDTPESAKDLDTTANREAEEELLKEADDIEVVDSDNDNEDSDGKIGNTKKKTDDSKKNEQTKSCKKNKNSLKGEKEAYEKETDKNHISKERNKVNKDKEKGKSDSRNKHDADNLDTTANKEAEEELLKEANSIDGDESDDVENEDTKGKNRRTVDSGGEREKNRKGKEKHKGRSHEDINNDCANRSQKVTKSEKDKTKTDEKRSTRRSKGKVEESTEDDDENESKSKNCVKQKDVKKDKKDSSRKRKEHENESGEESGKLKSEDGEDENMEVDDSPDDTFDKSLLSKKTRKIKINTTLETKMEKKKSIDSKTKTSDEQEDDDEEKSQIDEDDTSNSDDESSEIDDAGDETYAVKKRKKSSPRKVKGNKKEQSDKSSSKTTRSSSKGRKSGNKSSDFDSDLEEEIQKLSKTADGKKKKKSKESESGNESGPVRRRPLRSQNEDAKDSKKEKAQNKTKGKKKMDEDEMDDSTDEEKEEEEEEADSDTEVDDALKDIITKGENENAKSERQLLEEAEDEEEEEAEDNSTDSEIIISPRKTRTSRAAAAKKGKLKESSETEEEEDVPKKKKRKKDQLLDAKLSNSDSDFDLPKRKKRRRVAASDSYKTEESDSDSSQEFVKLGKRKTKKKGKNDKKPAGTGRARKRRRIKQVSGSSDENAVSSSSEDDMPKAKKDNSDESEEGDSPKKGRKKIRKIKGAKKLEDTTKQAQKAEEERRKRVAEKQKKYNNIVQEVDESSPTKCPITKQLVFEFDEETKKPVLEVDKGLVVKLKPHQVEAVEFIWNCTMESLERAKKEEGSGCLLAHCMGLGKTLTTLTFIHSMLVNKKKTKLKTCMVVCPLNTVLNWQHEFEMWQEYTSKAIDVYEMSSVKQNADRVYCLKEWQESGGVMILGYEMFRILTQGRNVKSKKMREAFQEYLVNPGPDIVVCDEGHVLKNDQSALSKSMSGIKTKRRIVLTGTPLQNNLIEYHCMVSFVKPSLLGTNKEFRNQFVNPITNGQHSDSTHRDVKIMKRRAHILHEKLNGCVQRKDYSALTKFLLPKNEYVISVRLSTIQMDLYQKYLDLAGFGTDAAPAAGRGAKLFADYQALMRIWTHPWVLKMDMDRQERKRLLEDEDDFIDDNFGSSSGSDRSSNSNSSSSEDDDDVVVLSDEGEGGSKKLRSKDKSKEQDKDEIVKKWKTRTRGDGPLIEEEEEVNPILTDDWWGEYVKPEDREKIELGAKLELLFEVLKMCEEIGDKVLIFSQSLLSLDLIEEFLEIVDKKHQEETLEKDKEKAKKDSSTSKKSKKILDSDDEDKEKEAENMATTQEVFGKHWTKGEDYFRMDGSTSANMRKNLAESFNDPENYRARLFLISTRAGGLGINLVAANRVIIFDASWNPSHDVQSIFRVYRFGQQKPVYVYRFLAQGTMEEKIYERQVMKQSLSQRVVDEHQIERHFSASDLAELYRFKPDRLDDPDRVEKTPMLPKDTLLAELMKSKKHLIYTFHEHDSLLENQIDQELSEEERKKAWEEFENEKKGISLMRQNFMANLNPGNYGMPPGLPYHAMNMNMNMNMNMMMGGVPGMNMALNQHNLLQLVQEMKQRYPNLPQEQLTAQVQSVIRQMITRQIAQQQDLQKRQMEEKEIHHQRQLNQIQAQIRQQQQQLQYSAAAGNNLPGINPSIYGMLRPDQLRSAVARQAGSSSTNSNNFNH